MVNKINPSVQILKGTYLGELKKKHKNWRIVLEEDLDTVPTKLLTKLKPVVGEGKNIIYGPVKPQSNPQLYPFSQEFYSDNGKGPCRERQIFEDGSTGHIDYPLTYGHASLKGRLEIAKAWEEHCSNPDFRKSVQLVEESFNF